MDYIIFFENRIDAIRDVSAFVSTAQYPKIYQNILPLSMKWPVIEAYAPLFDDVQRSVVSEILDWFERKYSCHRKRKERDLIV